MRDRKTKVAFSQTASSAVDDVWTSSTTFDGASVRTQLKGQKINGQRHKITQLISNKSVVSRYRMAVSTTKSIQSFR